jgi:hypothetical protein
MECGRACCTVEESNGYSYVLLLAYLPSFMGSISMLDGLVQHQQSTVETTSTNMRSALQDLEALMTQAGTMVALAESFNRSLMEHEATRQQLPEDAQFIIGSSMARLGLGMSYSYYRVEF